MRALSSIAPSGVTITGNKILNNQTDGTPVGMKGSSKDWHVANNSFAQNKDDGPAPLSIDSTVINNSGYNPVGRQRRKSVASDRRPDERRRR